MTGKTVKIGRGTVKIGGYEFPCVAYGQQETARMLGVTSQHLANMEERGELRTIRLGRRVLVPAAEIARLVGADDQANDLAIAVSVATEARAEVSRLRAAIDAEADYHDDNRLHHFATRLRRILEDGPR